MDQKLLNKQFSLWPGVFATLLSAAFGANAVAIKMSLLGVGPFTAAGLRLSMASLAILIWAKATGRAFLLDKKQVRPLLILSLLFVLQFSLLYLGISKTNASRATLLINLDPFFVLLLAHAFIPGDRITLRKFLGLLLAFSGIALVFLGRQGVTEDFRVGDAITLGSTFLWSCRTVYLKRVIHTFDPFQPILYPMMLSVPCFFLEGFLFDQTMIAYVDSMVLAGLLFQVGAASLGWVAWNSLLQKHGAVALHSFMFISPIAGVLLGGLLLAEPLTSSILGALILIILGILTAQFQKRGA